MSYLPELAISAEMMTQLEQEETPLRINSSQTTYYVLSAEQLMALLQPQPSTEQNHAFTPADFGLTAEDVAAYLERRAVRRQALAHATQ